MCVISLYYYDYLQRKIDLSRVHLVGISLGAHISGTCGSLLHGHIGRITGELSPSGATTVIKYLEMHYVNYFTSQHDFRGNNYVKSRLVMSFI